MVIISTSYSKTVSFSDPEQWLNRIDFYTGILEELSHKHDVYSIERINYTGEVKKNGVHYFFILLKNKTERFPWRMHRLIKKINPDAVLVNGFIFPFQIIQLRIRLGRKAKIIVLHRAEKPFRGVNRFMQKIAGKFIHAYLFTSKEMGNEWIEKNIISNKNKIQEVIQASSHFKPIDKNTARQKLQVEGSPVFLWVGRLDENKDPLTVVKAFTKFLREQPLARLYMIYQEDKLLHGIQELIKENPNAKHQVILKGTIPHKDLGDWYNAADFIISGSHYEGSGIGVCEAMSCGCIPVVTNIASFKKMTGPGKCGILYEAGNETGLLRALQSSMLMDLKKEKKNTLEQFEKELSFKAIARKIESVITS
jgi:glycosyltransferase involved in cell wall biosynthesis